MAKKREIEIEIDPDGNVQIRVLGMKGEECLKETADLEEALGIVRDRERTAEFYQEEETEAGRHIEQRES